MTTTKRYYFKRQQITRLMEMRTTGTAEYDPQTDGDHCKWQTWRLSLRGKVESLLSRYPVPRIVTRDMVNEACVRDYV